MKWFYFKNGSNPYGIFDNRTDLIFKMIVSWKVEMIDNDRFNCLEETKAYYGPVDYQFKKNALRDFAIEYQASFDNFDSSWLDCAIWNDFFEKYGRKYGLLREFRENGLC